MIIIFFGLVYKKTIIKSIENCDKIKLVSSIDNQNITTNYELLENDYINILFNNFVLFNCTIGYTYIVTEPDYEIFDEYPEEIDITYGNNNLN